MDNNNFKIDFFCVGAPKSATSWLYYCLKEHPQIFLPEKKEIDFFNKYKPFYSKTKEWNYKKGWEWYKSFFKKSKPNQIIGEFSVNYLCDKDTPKLIKYNFPNSKIIVILRNPIDRFSSHLIYAKSKNKIKKYYNAKNNDSLINDIIKNEKNFMSTGFYDNHIKNYFNYFKKNKILILFFEEIKNDPKKTLIKVFKFLDVEKNFIPKTINKKINSTKSKIFKYKNFKDISYVFKKRKFSKKTTQKLKDIYIPHIENLEKILKINLKKWK